MEVRIIIRDREDDSDSYRDLPHLTVSSSSYESYVKLEIDGRVVEVDAQEVLDAVSIARK